MLTLVNILVQMARNVNNWNELMILSQIQKCKQQMQGWQLSTKIQEQKCKYKKKYKYKNSQEYHGDCNDLWRLLQLLNHWLHCTVHCAAVDTTTVILQIYHCCDLINNISRLRFIFPGEIQSHFIYRNYVIQQKITYQNPLCDTAHHVLDWNLCSKTGRGFNFSNAFSRPKNISRIIHLDFGG